MISGAYLTAAASLVGIFILVLSAVIGWLARRMWQLKTQTIPQMQSDMQKLNQSYFGVPEDDADQGTPAELRDDISLILNKLDDLQEQQGEMQRNQHEDHAEVRRFLLAITRTLKDHGINGNLPSEEEIKQDHDRYK